MTFFVDTEKTLDSSYSQKYHISHLESKDRCNATELCVCSQAVHLFVITTTISSFAVIYCDQLKSSIPPHSK